MDKSQNYFNYLIRRSKLGLFYRRSFLYPRLSRHLRGTVLDIGCGIGDFVAFRERTVGVEINPILVSFCKNNGLDVRLMHEDRLPFCDRCFDGAILDNVLEHLEEPALLLREISRVLVPGAILIVGVPGKRGYESDPDHKAFYSCQALNSLISAYDFLPLRLMHFPVHLDILGAFLRQYCIYGVYQRL